MIATLRLLVQLALRGIVSHKVKSLIVGGILAVGTALLVAGTAYLNSIDRSMADSITGTLVGHLQVWSAKSRDRLTFFGTGGGSEDFGFLPEFGPVRAALEKVPGVHAVVPMGRDNAMMLGGNAMDRALEKLREAVKGGEAAAVRRAAARVRQLAGFMEGEYRNIAPIARDPEQARRTMEDLARATSDAFWEEFAREPEEALAFLDNRVAGVESGEIMVVLPYIGTDLDSFAEHFPRFKLAAGEMVPTGKRGLLLSQRFMDERLKNLVAVRLDHIRRDLRERGLTIAESKQLQDRVRANARAYGYLLYELDPEEAPRLQAQLRQLLPGVEDALPALLQAFLTVDDANFDARYDFFYKVVAPMIRLYRVNVGDVLTVRSITRSGYMRSVNVKVWGSFAFQGLESSVLAGGYNLMDLVSFRQLYGLMTPQRQRELERIRAAAGVEDVAREDAEAALFGGGGALEASAQAQAVEVAEEPAEAAANVWSDPLAPFDRADIDQGVAVNAAIILEDPKQLGPVMARIRELGPELGIQVEDWKAAAGILGQMVTLVKAVLYGALVIIFCVALVIINNSMLMATMDRVPEIGTMRAIGAQRRFVLGMYLVETLVLGALASAAGAALAAAVVRATAVRGIPAWTDQLFFLFGGPRLYPVLGPGDVVAAVLLIAFVSIVATWYPARVATRIAPVTAMQARE